LIYCRKKRLTAFEVYYYTDRDGNVRSREFLDQALVPNDREDEVHRRQNQLLKKLKPEEVDVISLRAPDETSQTDYPAYTKAW
jgi:hypothetical protein